METWEKVEKNPGDYLHNIRNAFEEMVHGWVNDSKAMPPEVAGNPELEKEWATEHQAAFESIAQGFRLIDALEQAGREWDKLRSIIDPSHYDLPF